MSDAETFLTALFGDKPKTAGIQLWRKDTKKTHPFAAVTPAAEYIAAVQNTDIYVSAGLAVKVGKPSNTRLTNGTVAAIPGVWVDLDVNGGPEGKTGAAPNFAAAEALANNVLTPTIIVASGYGIQAWWLFQGGPWLFESTADRESAARLVAAFQAAIRARAKQAGWGVDSTHDLARLMRVPGGRNHKGVESGWEPAPVKIHSDTGIRYTIEAISGVGAEYVAAAAEATRRITGEGVGIALNGERAIPSWRVGQMLAVDVDFKNMWERRKLGKNAGWSDSEFDLSIATRLADAGASDQEIADALVHNRLEHGDPKGKAGRLDYIKATIGRARTRADIAEASREAEIARTDAADQLEAIAVEGGADVSRTVSLFTQVLGGPEVKELIQDSRDPDQARFRLVLADGREVPIGSGAELLSPDRFRSAFAVVTGYVVPDVKRPKWHKIVQALLQAAVVNESSEDTRAARAVLWLRDYIDRGLSTDKNAACQAADPFQEGTIVHIALGPFVHWLRRMRGERLNDADVKQLLIAAGFERKTINYVREDNKKSSRSYWLAELETLEATE